METRTVTVKAMVNALGWMKGWFSSSVKKCSCILPAVHLTRGDYNGKAAVCHPLPKQLRLEVCQAAETILTVSIDISSYIKALVKRRATDPSLDGAPCQSSLRHQYGFLTRILARSRMWYLYFFNPDIKPYRGITL